MRIPIHARSPYYDGAERSMFAPREWPDLELRSEAARAAYARCQLAFHEPIGHYGHRTNPSVRCPRCGLDGGAHPGPLWSALLVRWVPRPESEVYGESYDWGWLRFAPSPVCPGWRGFHWYRKTDPISVAELPDKLLGHAPFLCNLEDKL